MRSRRTSVAVAGRPPAVTSDASPEIKHTRGERRTRIALHIGEEEASSLLVHDLEMRVGDVPVRMGGIGNVETKRSYRRKGYARKVIEDAGAFMTEDGFDVSLLFGISDFYPKFGYAVCMADCSLSLRTAHAERASALFPFAPAEESDREDVRGLYERTNSSRTGALVRRKGRWKGPMWAPGWAEGPRCFAAKDASGLRRDEVASATQAGGLEAYVILADDNERTRAVELAARSREGYEAVVRFLADDAVAKRAGSVRVLCPCDHPLVDVASRFGVRLELERPRCGGAMGKIVNQRRLFEKLLPLFSRRLSSSGLRGRKFAVSISTELGIATIGFDGRVASLDESASAESCEMGASGLMQVVMGYCDAVAAGARFGGEVALEAVGALFPRQEAHMWHPDHF
jgi:hypothetical protein